VEKIEVRRQNTGIRRLDSVQQWYLQSRGVLLYAPELAEIYHNEMIAHKKRKEGEKC